MKIPHENVSSGMVTKPHIRTYTTLHIICTMWTLNTATSHTCSYDEESVETVWRKGTYKWASGMRAKVCASAYIISKTQFLGSHQLKKANKRQFIVCHAKYNLPSTCIVHTSCEIMWLGLLFTFAVADADADAAIHFVVCITVAAYKWIKVLCLAFTLAPIYPLSRRLLSPAPLAALDTACVCAHLHLYFFESYISRGDSEVR